MPKYFEPLPGSFTEKTIQSVVRMTMAQRRENKEPLHAHYLPEEDLVRIRREMNLSPDAMNVLVIAGVPLRAYTFPDIYTY